MTKGFGLCSYSTIMNKEENVSNAFKKLIHALTAGKNKMFCYCDITLYRAEVHILEIIGKNSGITATDIAIKMEITKGAISQIISKLLEKELIYKSSPPENTKIQNIYLTKKGEDVLLYHDNYEKELVEKISLELKECREEDILKFINTINFLTEFIRK